LKLLERVKTGKLPFGNKNEYPEKMNSANIAQIRTLHTNESHKSLPTSGIHERVINEHNQEETHNKVLMNNYTVPISIEEVIENLNVKNKKDEILLKEKSSTNIEKNYNIKHNTESVLNEAQHQHLLIQLKQIVWKI
jgi:hypothetical protein